MAIIPFKTQIETELFPSLARPYSSLQREINRLFDSFWSETALSPTDWTSGASSLQPKMDIAENEKAYIVTAELPGMEEKDIELSIHNGVLTLKGEKRQSKEEKENNYMRMERSYGAFYRAIPFPAKIEDEKARADFKNGVLTVAIPKSAEALKATKKVPINK